MTDFCHRVFGSGRVALRCSALVLGVSASLSGVAWAQNAAPAQPALERIQARGSVIIGHRESSIPLSYLADGKPVGYSLDLCGKVAEAIGRHLKMKDLKVQYQLVTSANRLDMVERGEVDLECGSTTNNATRQKDVAFAVTTFVEEVRIAVKANSGITSIAQLNGKNVATTTGTTSVQTLRKNERAGGIDFKEVFGKDHADSFLLLESGRADAFVMDAQILAGNIANAKNPADFKIVGEVLNVEPIAIMIRKDDPAFKKLADDTIAALAKSGELAKLYDKWFVQPIPPKGARLNMPASDTNKAAWANLNDKPAEDYAKK